MKTLEELMQKQFLVASFTGHAIFWNHSRTFNVYAIDDAGRAEAVECYTREFPEGISDPKKIRWAIYCGRELADELKGQE